MDSMTPHKRHLSSIVGPTIKLGSGLRKTGMLPTIPAANKSIIVNDYGENEPLMKSLSHAPDLPGKDIVDIQYWQSLSQTAQEVDLMETD